MAEDQTHYVGDGCVPPHEHFVGDGCDPPHLEDDIPAVPLREPSTEDLGEPMSPEALAEQERFDQEANEAHARLERGELPVGAREIALLYVPMKVDTFVALTRAIISEFPEAKCWGDVHGNVRIFTVGETGHD